MAESDKELEGKFYLLYSFIYRIKAIQWYSSIFLYTDCYTDTPMYNSLYILYVQRTILNRG